MNVQFGSRNFLEEEWSKNKNIINVLLRYFKSICLFTSRRSTKISSQIIRKIFNLFHIHNPYKIQHWIYLSLHSDCDQNWTLFRKLLVNIQQNVPEIVMIVLAFLPEFFISISYQVIFNNFCLGILPFPPVEIEVYNSK